MSIREIIAPRPSWLGRSSLPQVVRATPAPLRSDPFEVGPSGTAESGGWRDLALGRFHEVPVALQSPPAAHPPARQSDAACPSCGRRACARRRASRPIPPPSWTAQRSARRWGSRASTCTMSAPANAPSSKPSASACCQRCGVIDGPSGRRHEVHDRRRGIGGVPRQLCRRRARHFLARLSEAGRVRKLKEDSKQR